MQIKLEIYKIFHRFLVKYHIMLYRWCYVFVDNNANREYVSAAFYIALLIETLLHKIDKERRSIEIYLFIVVSFTQKGHVSKSPQLF